MAIVAKLMATADSNKPAFVLLCSIGQRRNALQSANLQCWYKIALVAVDIRVRSERFVLVTCWLDVVVSLTMLLGQCFVESCR